VGTLPAGLSLDGSSGSITGVPSVADVYNFTVQLTDSAAVTASRAYTITVAPQVPVLGPGTTVKGKISIGGKTTVK
jgi:hypothetical protein